MSVRIRKNAFYLRLLLEDSGTLQFRKALLKHASKEQLRAVLELIGNILYRNIRAPEGVLKKETKHKGVIKSLWGDRQKLELKRVKLIKYARIVLRFLTSAKTFLDRHVLSGRKNSRDTGLDSATSNPRTADAAPNVSNEKNKPRKEN